MGWSPDHEIKSGHIVSSNIGSDTSRFSLNPACDGIPLKRNVKETADAVVYHNSSNEPTLAPLSLNGRSIPFNTEYGKTANSELISLFGCS